MLAALSLEAPAQTSPRPAPAEAVPRLLGNGLLSVALAIGCLWYLDALTTAWALERGAIELGPLMQHVVGYGWVALLAVKAVGLGCILVLAWLHMRSNRASSAHWGLTAVGSISAAIVTWNLLMILRLEGVL